MMPRLCEQAALSGPCPHEPPAHIPATKVQSPALGLTGQWLAGMRARSADQRKGSACVPSTECERKADWVDKAKHDMACKKAHEFVEVEQPEGWDGLSSCLDPSRGPKPAADCHGQADNEEVQSKKKKTLKKKKKASEKKPTKKTQQKKKRLSKGGKKSKNKRARRGEPHDVACAKKRRNNPQTQEPDATIPANKDQNKDKPKTNRKATAKPSNCSSQPSKSTATAKPKASPKTKAKAKAKAKATAARTPPQPSSRTRGQPLDDPVKEAARLKKSRKSTAYHEAYTRAEGQGFPEEQCKEQARAASYQH